VELNLAGQRLPWEPGFEVPSLCIMSEEKRTTVLCPACKNRMSVKQISHAMVADEYVYHCAMCDLEIKQQGPQLAKAPLEPAASP
jgi:hypothetical protein